MVCVLFCTSAAFPKLAHLFWHTFVIPLSHILHETPSYFFSAFFGNLWAALSKLPAFKDFDLLYGFGTLKISFFCYFVLTNFITKCLQVGGCNEIYEDYTLEHIYLNFLAVIQRFWLSSETVWNVHAIYSVCCLASAGCLLPFCLSRINLFLAAPLVTSSFLFIPLLMVWHSLSISLQLLLGNTN